MARGSRKGFDYRLGKAVEWDKQEVAALKAGNSLRRIAGDTLVFALQGGSWVLIAEVYE